jgi:hypothetical protein
LTLGILDFTVKATPSVLKRRMSESAFPESAMTSLVLSVAAGTVATRKENAAGNVTVLRLSDGQKSRQNLDATELSYCFSPRSPNQSLERNVYVRHASCEARVTPAIAVAHF